MTDRTLAQGQADKQLDAAIVRVVEAYDLLPTDADALDYMAALAEICAGIMAGGIDALRERNADGEAEGRSPQVHEQGAVEISPREVRA